MIFFFSLFLKRTYFFRIQETPLKVSLLHLDPCFLFLWTISEIKKPAVDVFTVNWTSHAAYTRFSHAISTVCRQCIISHQTRKPRVPQVYLLPWGANLFNSSFAYQIENYKGLFGFLFVFFNTRHWGWRVGSVAKYTCCSCRRPDLNSWYPHGGLRLAVTQVPGDPNPSSDLCWHQACR